MIFPGKYNFLTIKASLNLFHEFKFNSFVKFFTSFCIKFVGLTSDKCQLNNCIFLSRKIYLYTSIKCINCQGPHFTNSNFYSKRLEILEKFKKNQKRGISKVIRKS